MSRFTELPPPTAILRCDGCGDLWLFTASSRLRSRAAYTAFVEDALDTVEDTHHCDGRPAAPGYFVARQAGRVTE